MLRASAAAEEIDPDDPVARMISDATKHYAAKLPLPQRLSKEQLRSLTMPVYVAMAADSYMHDSAATTRVAVRRSVRRVRQQGPFLHLLRAVCGTLGTHLLPGRQLRYLPAHHQYSDHDHHLLITFLLVALLQNTQKRSEQALQHKLDAVADGLADLMEHFAEDDPERRAAKEDLSGDIEDLKAAVGLEGEM